MRKSTLLCLAMLFFFAACKESPTIVDGVVVNKVTGEPLPLSSIDYYIHHNKSDYSGTEFKSIRVDSTGRFYIWSEDPISYYGAYSAGCLWKFNGFEPIIEGKINNAVIEMVPRDGFLSLTVQNTTNQKDTVHVGLYSSLQQEELYLSSGIMNDKVFILEAGASNDTLFNVTSEEIIKVYWRKGINPQPHYLPKYSWFESVFVPRNDTGFVQLTL